MWLNDLDVFASRHAALSALVSGEVVMFDTSPMFSNTRFLSAIDGQSQSNRALWGHDIRDSDGTTVLRVTGPTASSPRISFDGADDMKKHPTSVAIKRGYETYKRALAVSNESHWSLERRRTHIDCRMFLVSPSTCPQHESKPARDVGRLHRGRTGQKLLKCLTASTGVDSGLGVGVRQHAGRNQQRGT